MSEAVVDRDRKYIGIQEVADMLGVCYSTVRYNIVPYVEHMKVGRRILIDEASMHKFFKEQRRKAGGE